MKHIKSWLPVISLASFLAVGAAVCALLPLAFGLPANTLFNGVSALSDMQFVKTVLLFGGVLLALALSHILPYRLGYWNVAAAGEFLVSYVAVSLLDGILPLWAAGLVALAVGLFLGLLIGILRAYTPIHEGWSGLVLSVLGVGGYEAVCLLLPAFSAEAEIDLPIGVDIALIALPLVCALAIFIVISAKRRKKVFAFDKKRGSRGAAVWSLSLAGGLAGLAAVCFCQTGSLSGAPADGTILPVAIGALAFGVGVVSAENALIAIFISYLTSLFLSIGESGKSTEMAHALFYGSIALMLVAAAIAFVVRHCLEAKQNKTEKIVIALPKREAPKIDPEDDEDGELPTISSILGGKQ